MIERIGKYHVIRAAGSGGFGTVYEGYDVELDRNVAIKICTGGESQLERFRREARVVSQLKHRNVALVYDFGFDEDAAVHYLVEEFLSGVDLDKKFDDRDRLPPSLRLRYMMGIAQGLEFVHERGLIHRDLSPRNIRVLHDHTIKIMDFGLAKDATDSTLTLMGDNFGTIGYTAPEQVTGMRTVDQRTDIFSFGVIAYELLTHTNPFMAENMGRFIQKIHHHEPRPLTELWPGCPPELAAVIHRCMEKTPEERTPSCSEVLPILRKTLRYLRDHDVPAIYSPPEEENDDRFESILDALPAPGSPRPAAGRQRTGDVDSIKLTSPLDVPGQPTRPVFDASMPVARATKPADDVPSTLISQEAAAARRSAVPGALFALVVAAGLAVLIFAMRSGSETGAAEPAAADPAPPAVREAPPEAVPEAPPERGRASGAFELTTVSTGMPEKPWIQLFATFPEHREGLSHCYVLREPPWSYGAKIRRDCAGDVFRELDKLDVQPRQRYTYRVQLANAAGDVLWESSPSSVIAGD